MISKMNDQILTKPIDEYRNCFNEGKTDVQIYEIVCVPRLIECGILETQHLVNDFDQEHLMICQNCLALSVCLLLYQKRMFFYDEAL